MLLPPLEPGGVHETVACESPAVAATPVGAPGTVALTVREAEPLLGSYELSPAKLAATPDGYVPGAMPARLAPLSVATPLELVVALPAAEPLSVKLTVSPLTAVAP